MAYRVFARKYRPQRFEEVVGQEHVTRTIQNAIRLGRIAQAYLFVGPRGIGKTSTARILAKALNCKDGPTPTPCCVCGACISIAEGNFLDVLEIDGASNNSVEHIRELRENVGYAPALGKYKIYLIDEVHMLSTAAFNALLKTLEEPPEHVKFIFATTEAQKVPATITSRCQRFDLRRISTAAIRKHLLQIAEKESLALEEAAAESIAKAAAGGLRDAESMLDQAVAFCGETIHASDVEAIFGLTSSEVTENLATAIFEQDVPAALAIVANQNEAGKDLSRLLDDLISTLRDRLVAAASAGTPQRQILDLLDHFSATESKLRWAPDRKLHFDVAIIKAIHLLGQVSLDDVIETLGKLQTGEPLPPSLIRPSAPSATGGGRTTSKLSPRVEATVRDSVAAALPETPADARQTGNVQAAAASTGSAETEAPPPGLEDQTAWQTALAEECAQSIAVAHLIEGVRFVRREGRVFHIEFPSNHASTLQTIRWAKVKASLEKRIGTKISSNIRLEAAVGDFSVGETQEPEQPDVQPSSAVETPDPPASAPSAPSAPKDPKELLEDFRNDPVIKKALEIFAKEIQTSS